MLATAVIAKHVLIICCYGGAPYVDLRSTRSRDWGHVGTQVIDPTDWMAIDLPGTLLNASVHPEFLDRFPILAQLVPPNVLLEQCDLYNLTFTSSADQEFYENNDGHVKCRCPRQLSGNACEIDARVVRARALIAETPLRGGNGGSAEGARSMQASQQPLPAGAIASPPAAALAVCLIVVAVLAGMAMRGFFCDCFGPFKRPTGKDDLEGPLDQNSVNRCLEAVRKHHQSQAFRDQQPLISTVSNGYAPYAGRPIIRPHTPPQARQQQPSAPRGGSPPPSYRSSQGSLNCNNSSDVVLLQPSTTTKL